MRFGGTRSVWPVVMRLVVTIQANGTTIIRLTMDTRR
jgi:hypothetical protein